MADPMLEEQIVAWRGYVSRKDAIDTRDVDELEDHLRDEIDSLGSAGLAADEAFLVAVKRLGAVDELSREFALEHSDRLWKQLMFAEDPAEYGGGPRSAYLAVGVACAAAVAVKVPALFGITFSGDPGFYGRFLVVLVLPFLAAYFLARRRATAATTAAVAAPFAAAAALLAIYPFGPDSATLVLAVIHSAVVLWMACGVAYVNGDVGSARARMDFVRFTGEWFVYFVLIALGGGALIALTMGVFSAIGVDAGTVVAEWLLPCGVAGAVVIAAWLVEAKQSVIENIAPVLTRLFTPLFTLLLLTFIVVGVLQRSTTVQAGGTVLLAQRDLLILFDMVLVVILGLLLYGLSARDPFARPGWFDRLQLVMVLAAIGVDALVLTEMIDRIGEFGASPNKLASLGLNAILLVNLAGAAWLQLRFLTGQASFDRVERWQTGHLPVYLAWAAVVAVVFPPLFGFV